MDYNLKGKSPGIAHRPDAPTGSPRVGIVAAMNSPKTTGGLGGILAPKIGGAKPSNNASSTSKKVSTDAEIKEKLTGYVLIDQTYWSRLPQGTHIRYFARGDGPRPSRFRTGGFIVSWTKSANGKVYLKIANQLEFTNKQAGYRDFSVDAANVAEIWAKPEILDKVKNEVSPNDLIKQLVDEVATLKIRVAALERKNK